MSHDLNTSNNIESQQRSAQPPPDEAPPSYESVVYGDVACNNIGPDCRHQQCHEAIPLSSLDRGTCQHDTYPVTKNSFVPCQTTSFRIGLKFTKITTNPREELKHSNRTERVRFSRTSTSESSQSSQSKSQTEREHLQSSRSRSHSERESSYSSRSRSHSERESSRSCSESRGVDRVEITSDLDTNATIEDRHTQFSSNMCFSIIICLCCNPFCGLFAIACSSMADVAREQGDLRMARKHSNRAFLCGIIGIFTTMAVVGGILASGLFNTRII